MALWFVAYLATAGRPLVVHHERHTVLPDFVTAGARWTQGQPLYVRGGPNEFRYSPAVATAFVPLSRLPARWGEFAWRSLNFAALVGGLAYAGRAGLAGRWTVGRACTVFLLALPVSIGSLNNGQSNPLVMGLMLAAAAAAVERRWNVAAAALVVATCFKLYPIALALLLVMYHPRPLGWRVLLGLAVAAAVPFLLQHASYVAHQYGTWARYLATEDRQRGPRADWYRDLRAVWRSYVGHMSQSTYRWVEVAAGGAIAGLCLAAQRCRWPDGPLAALAVGLSMCWMTALGPATESATYLFLAPPLAWGLARTADGDRRGDRWLRIGYGVVLGLLLVAAVAVNLPGGRVLRERLEPLPIAGLLLLAVLSVEACSHLRRPVPSALTPPA